jgi:hypothetical protein
MVPTSKVNLTKDNLEKHNWNGYTKCPCCDFLESLNHLFYECPFASLVWRVNYFIFDITPPANITNMFRNWLNGVDRQTKERIQVETCALVWDI